MLLQSCNLTVPEKLILRGYTTTAVPVLQVTSALIEQGILVLLQSMSEFIMQIRQLGDRGSSFVKIVY